MAAREAVRAGGGIELRHFLSEVRRRRRGPGSADTPFISVLHVDDLGVVAWREARHYRPSTPGIAACATEILVSLLNPRKFRATVIPSRYPMVECSAEFGVFKAHVHAYGVLALLQQPLVRAQIAPLGRGTSSSRRRIEPEDVLRVLVPHWDPATFAGVGEEVKEALESQAEAEAQLLLCYSVSSPSESSSPTESSALSAARS